MSVLYAGILLRGPLALSTVALPSNIDVGLIIDAIITTSTDNLQKASVSETVCQRTGCQLNVLSAKCAVSETTKQDIFVSETVCQLIDQSAKRPVS